jgi:hypothetical protein
MKSKILNLGLILTSLFGYLEWGSGNHAFLFQAEWELLGKLFTDPVSVIHPFTLLPLAGQLILLFTLFQRTPGKWLTLTGLACISILLVFMFLVGVMALSWKIVLSTLPFLLVGVWVVLHHRTAHKT